MNVKKVTFSNNRAKGINSINNKNSTPRATHGNGLDIYLTAYIKNKSYIIYCGDGRQKVKWVIDAVLHKFDRNYALESGIPSAIRLPNEELILDFNEPIFAKLKDFSEVFILLKDDYENLLEANKKKKSFMKSSSSKSKSPNKRK